MSLIGEERKRIIIDLLEDNGEVTTAELVLLLQVSKETVRRYLDDLEAQGKLKKIYGGAVKRSYAQEESPYLERVNLFQNQKTQIGRLAAGLVQDGDVLFLDEGTTTLSIVPHLNHQHLTIVTHSFPIAALLIERSHQHTFKGRVLFLGGEISVKQARCSGSITENMLSYYYVDKAFISVDALHPEAGITSLDEGKALISRKAIAQTSDVIVISDSSKLGQRSPYKISGLEHLSRIVCDLEPPIEWRTALQQHSIEWLTAAEI
ncbi:transcriptional regulator, DeoR family [Paenibacillus sp. 1_12]|uniref:DeoR/GlpR family DNA-binding transcription regulator n=1 Tax=Paenibacillus sp. 1_12 TaxID=1566278 RepID=UPI0008F438BE|nr:DeoR/GlpR family DNA-binding transcription regulator [Paenibacillus sp. 1_12]SFK96070.1 transcriptional regulator, DeoR family [Paenibacillus sp. 1_12]